MECSFVSRRDSEDERLFPSIASALESVRPALVWICTETSRHKEDLAQLDELNYSGNILVEKPLFAFPQSSQPRNLKKNSIFVSYNLRLHPHIKYLKDELKSQKVVSANCYVGQHLSQWRTNQDYKESYSADAELGGGCLRDLSHEIDYCINLFGRPLKLASYGHFSNVLNISSDELYQIQFATVSGTAVSIELNYLDRAGRRWLLINTDKHTYFADFVSGTLMKDHDVVIQGVRVKETYSEQARLASQGDFSPMCTYEEAVYINEVIARIEDSNWFKVEV